MNEFILSKSDKPQKKYKITFINPTTNRQNTLYFGASGYEDFTTSIDESRKSRYLKRHAKRENWDDLTTSGAWSKSLLWNQPSLRQSIRDTEKRFKIKIVYDI